MIVDYDENHNLQKARYKFLKVYYNKTSNDRIVSYIKKCRELIKIVMLFGFLARGTIPLLHRTVRMSTIMHKNILVKRSHVTVTRHSLRSGLGARAYNN